MVRYGLLMNPGTCFGCRSCMLACKDVFEIPVGNYQGREYYRVWPADVELGKYPYAVRNQTIMRCMQCQNPPCIAACPIYGALTQRKDGIVVVDTTKCIGCMYCVAACPYGALYFRLDTKAVDKCDFCANQLDAGQAAPTCVTYCIGEAMIFGNLDDPTSTISQKIKELNAKPLHPEYGTSPSVYYVPHAAVLHAQVVDDVGAIVPGATPKLTDLSTHTTATTYLDNQGRFVFRNLKVGNVYSLTVAASGYNSYTLSALSMTSEYLDLGKVALNSR